MKYTIELTEKQANQLNDIMIGINASWGYASAPNLKKAIPIKQSPAYKKGFEDGNKIADKDLKEIQDSTYDVAYIKGVADFENLFVHEHDYEQFFEDTYGSKDPDYNLYDLVAKYGAKKVVDDFKKWQEEKKKAEEEIKVGDEVTIGDGDTKAIVTRIEDRCIRVLYSDGTGGLFTISENALHKTGQNFSNVLLQLLDKLRCEERMKLQFQDRLDCPHSYNTEDNKNLQCDCSFCEICDGTLYEHCLWDMDESVIERCEDDK